MDQLYIVRRARGIRSAQKKDVVRGGFDLQQFRWERSVPTQPGGVITNFRAASPVVQVPGALRTSVKRSYYTGIKK